MLLILALAFLFSACTTQVDDLCYFNEFSLSLDEAKEIADASECGSNFGENFVCNENTGTYWLDLNLEKPGCNPACVVNIETGEAEINWRCTGLIPEEKPCTKEYAPVCGEVQVECIAAPCNPIKQTFGNRCVADNAGAENIVEGECVEEINLEGACLSFDGVWVEEANECEGMGKEMCEDLGGTFNECASACRNNPDAQVCTLQCVLVCEFE